MAYLTGALGGIGRSRVKISDPTGAREIFDYTFPLTQQDGFLVDWNQVGFIQTQQSLNITAPKIREIPFVIGFMPIWDMRYENLALPADVAEKIIEVVNNQGLFGNNNQIQLWPKYDTLPDYFWYVNYIGGGLKFRNHDKRAYFANLGLNLMFKVRESVNNISMPGVPDPTTAPGGGEVFTPITGQKQT